MDLQSTRADKSKVNVFISYSRTDMAFADRLEVRLRERGFAPLIDRTDIHAFEDWWKRIQTLVVKADTVVFVISPHSVSSDVCRKELAFAASLNKRLAPVVCRSIDPATLPHELSRLNLIFLHDDATIESRFDRLVDALSTDIEWIRKHTEFGEQARRWSDAVRARSRGLLLRSPVLEEAERWIASRPADAPRPTEATQAFIAESRRAATRLRNALTGALVAIVIVTLGLAGLAYFQRGIAVAERDQALLTQSRFLADLANQHSGNGDAVGGMSLALEAVPDSSSSVKRPYAPEAESALFRARFEPHESALLRGHERAVWSASFSPDGQRVVTTSVDQTARVWDVASGKEISVLKGHDDVVHSAFFSPDGRRIVTACGSSEEYGFNDLTARTWDANSGREIAVLKGHEAPIANAAFSPDGRHVVTASSDHTARLWDADNGKLVATLEGHEDVVSGAQFSPDGSYIVTTSADHTARLWEVGSHKETKLLKHDGNVERAVFSADGRRVVTASTPNAASSPYTLRVWDPESGIETTTLKLHLGDFVRSFSRDGRRAVVTRKDHSVQIWDLDSATEVAVLIGHTDDVWDAEFSNDGQLVVTASNDMTARVWNASDGKEVSVLRGHTDGLNSAMFSPNARYVVTTSGNPELSKDSTARLWEIGNRGASIFKGHNDGLNSVEFSGDGRLMVTASDDQTARVWDVASGKQIAELTHDGPGVGVYRAQISGDGRYVLTKAANNARDFIFAITVWDLKRGKSVRAIAKPRGANIDLIGISPDGRWTVTTSTVSQKPLPPEHIAEVWDVESGALISTLHDFDVTGPSNVPFSHDGRYVLSVSRAGGVGVWETGTWERVAAFAKHGEEFDMAAFSAGGRHVITLSKSTNTIRVWDAMSGNEIAAHRLLDQVGDWLSFNEDERHMIDSSDNVARVWDLESGKVIAELKGHEKVIKDVTFAPDGRTIATASFDGTARIWRFFGSTQDLVDETKQVITRCLTTNERQKAFLDPAPPTWCIEMKKWPYDSQDWTDWLKFERINSHPPLPDNSEWTAWVAAHAVQGSKH